MIGETHTKQLIGVLRLISVFTINGGEGLMGTSNLSHDVESASQQARYHMTKAKKEMMKDILKRKSAIDFCKRRNVRHSLDATGGMEDGGWRINLTEMV